MGAEKYVEWNREQEGFLDEWLWKYGEGPFKVVAEQRVPDKPGRLGFGANSVEIVFGPGTWYTISAPNSVFERNYSNRGFDKVLFHEKWLKDPSEE